MCIEYSSCEEAICCPWGSIPGILLLASLIVLCEDALPLGLTHFAYTYRDSYFVIRGLLVSELHNEAKDMLLNFLDFVEEYGFIRKYA